MSFGRVGVANSETMRLTDSPKNTMSGLTKPPQSLHLTMSPVSTPLFIAAPSNDALQSTQCWDAKLPCASTMRSPGTPA